MFAVIAYCAAMVTANLSVANFGPWVSPINAFVLIGLDLSLRDRLHERWHGPRLWHRMAGLIAVAGLLSYAANPAAGWIALASFVAFVVSGALDAVTYHWLRREPYLVKSNGSNIVGAAFDSLLFSTIAFGSFMPAIIALQFVAKVSGGFLWSLIFARPTPPAASKMVAPAAPSPGLCCDPARYDKGECDPHCATTRKESSPPPPATRRRET